MTLQLLDPRFADAIVASVQEIFESMVAMSPDAIDGNVEPQQVVANEVIASLGFTGTKTGLVVLAGPQELVTTMCAGMLMMEPSEITDQAEIADSFGEITNMVAGNFKNDWVEAGNTMDLSIPTVSFGERISLTTGKDSTISFAADVHFSSGALRVELRMHD